MPTVPHPVGHPSTAEAHADRGPKFSAAEERSLDRFMAKQVDPLAIRAAQLKAHQAEHPEPEVSNTYRRGQAAQESLTKEHRGTLGTVSQQQAKSLDCELGDLSPGKTPNCKVRTPTTILATRG